MSRHEGLAGTLCCHVWFVVGHFCFSLIGYEEVCFLFALSVLFSCQSKVSEKKVDVSPVLVEDFEGNTLKLEDVVAEVREIKLHDDSVGYIGKIKDVCAVDSFIYVLDEITFSISKFQWSDGALVSSIRTHGSGLLEYIQPVALSADDKYVYLLDLSGMAILVYDKNLKAKEKVKLSFSAIDFVKVPDGFLCYNPVPTNDLGQIVHIDSEGKIRNHYLNGGLPSVSSNSKVFGKDAGGDVFIAPFFSQSIYMWNSASEEPDKLLSVDFGAHNIPANMLPESANPYEQPYAIPVGFFKTSKGCVQSFLCKNKRYYSFIHPDKTVSGAVSRESPLPFFPQWQMKDYLVGTCPLENLPSEQEAGQGNEETGEVLLLFALK